MCSVNECLRILLLTVVLTQSLHVGLTGESQPLKVNLKILNQKYCSGESSISAVQLALRLEVFNVTHKTLIVQKSIGRAWYREIVARDEESLAAGNFEYNPNIEFLRTKSDEQVPSTDAPGDDFILLGPGKSFEAESLVDIPTRTGPLSPLNKGLIQAGQLLPSESDAAAESGLQGRTAEPEGMHVCQREEFRSVYRRIWGEK